MEPTVVLTDNRSRLWSEVHDLFDMDDGSLPEIRINFQNAKAMVEGYALLRTRAASVLTNGAYFWSIVRGQEVPLEAVPNAAALVVSGQAEPFHVVLGEIRLNDTAIPDLGVFVFHDQLVLNYQAGPHWGEREVTALFELLSELVAFDQLAQVFLQDQVVRVIKDRFTRAWLRWRNERAR